VLDLEGSSRSEKAVDGVGSLRVCAGGVGDGRFSEAMLRKRRGKMSAQALPRPTVP
jgi:hypothetical protein